MWAGDCGSPAGLGSLCRRCFLCLGVGEEGLRKVLPSPFSGVSSPITMRKLEKLAVQFPDVYRRTWTEETGGNVTAARYEMDARYIRFGRPASAAQVEASRANAVKMHSTLKTAL